MRLHTLLAAAVVLAVPALCEEEVKSQAQPFTYPTVDGVIGAVQWGGFREGVDEVRCMTTLLRAVENPREAEPDLAKEAQQWIDSVDVTGDLDGVRSETIGWILKLAR